MNNIDQFKLDSVVLDTETTNLHPELCEIVEIAGAKWNGVTWSAENLLLGAYNGIPPEASAKNNISNRMIADKPKFDQTIDNVKQIIGWPDKRYYVAHNAAYDRVALTTAFTSAGLLDDAKICADDSRWVCTWRLSRQILIHEFDDVQFGLSYLRYKLDLPIPDDMPVHRADADTLVCAALLDCIIRIGIDNGTINENDDIGEQLVKLSWGHIPVKNWPIGKHKGQPLADIPNDYYMWALKNVSSLQEGQPEYNSDLAESVRQLLEQRLLNAA